MAHDFEAAIYVRSAPEFRFEEDGMFHVCHATGRSRFELVMRPNTFLKALKAADKAAAEFLDRDDAEPIRGGGAH